ncbi:MAG: ribonuclease HII [Deltaproteobacteria bacterium]|jgi:ribonuclease HII|nr:ribonuclease HII [Deltaproteobacteria bacterium]
MSGRREGSRSPKKAAPGGFFGTGPDTVATGLAGWELLLRFDRGFPERPLCGVDEAGRGPLAGPLVAAAVILDPDKPYPGVDDSKKLDPAERERLYGLITEGCVAHAVSVVGNREVDLLNPLGATMLAMERSVLGLATRPALVLVDGNRLPRLPVEGRCVVKGDSRSLSIAAASIIAKVTRDRIMLELHLEYPGYGFDRHKGYGTRGHLAALRELGPSPVHRLSYKGVLQPPGGPSGPAGGLP